MKCRIIREDIEVHEPSITEEMRADVVYVPTFRNGAMQPVAFWKLGTILDHPQAYMLVRQGCAEPADDACAQRAARSPEQQRAAQHAYERLTRGIVPEDFSKYDAGIITGYEPDGSYTPGPNWHMMPPPEDEDDE